MSRIREALFGVTAAAVVLSAGGAYAAEASAAKQQRGAQRAEPAKPAMTVSQKRNADRASAALAASRRRAVAKPASRAGQAPAVQQPTPAREATP
jgi:hypothetical protein